MVNNKLEIFFGIGIIKPCSIFGFYSIKCGIIGFNFIPQKVTPSKHNNNSNATTSVSG